MEAGTSEERVPGRMGRCLLVVFGAIFVAGFPLMVAVVSGLLVQPLGCVSDGPSLGWRWCETGGKAMARLITLGVLAHFLEPAALLAALAVLVAGLRGALGARD